MTNEETLEEIKLESLETKLENKLEHLERKLEAKHEIKNDLKPKQKWRFHKFRQYESQYQPPDQIFSIVWILLYTAYIYNLISTKGNVGLTVNLSIGLFLNVFWIFAFLNYKNPNIALYVITVMIVLSVDAIVRMGNADFVLQCVYQVFYLAWLVFAFYLNGIIVKNYCIDHKIRNIFSLNFAMEVKQHH
jgi:tryptophan-rich sensory protein